MASKTDMSQPTLSAPRRRSLDQLHIPSPCPASWEAMRDDGGRRHFCDACQKHVHDLTDLTSTDADALIANAHASGRSICVRFRQHADGSVVTRDRPADIRRPLPGWRRLVASIATVLGLGTLLTGSAGCDRDAVANNALTRFIERALYGSASVPPPMLVAGTMPVLQGDVAPPTTRAIAGAVECRPPPEPDPATQPAFAEADPQTATAARE